MRICKRLSLFHYNVTYINMYWQEQSGLFKNNTIEIGFIYGPKQYFNS